METYASKKEREERENKEYMNRMKRTLHQRIQDNIFPNWRCHASLNGLSRRPTPRLELHELSLRSREPEEPTQGVQAG